MDNLPKEITEPLLTTEDICVIFDVKPVTVWRWAKKGKLPGFKQGKRWFFRKADIVELARSGYVRYINEMDVPTFLRK